MITSYLYDLTQILPPAPLSLALLKFPEVLRDLNPQDNQGRDDDDDIGDNDDDNDKGC